MYLTMKKNTIISITFVIIILIAILAVKKDSFFLPDSLITATSTPSTLVIVSFADCANAKYPVMESNPRRCATPGGRTYIEEIKEVSTYKNASSSTIVVDLPQPGSVTGKEFIITGKARRWYFEGSFPVQILDRDGKILSQGPAKAVGDWMTSEFVPFTYKATVPSTYLGKATVVLMKDNPSGLPENDASISFPITIEY
jgi:hypothetical protein